VTVGAVAATQWHNTALARVLVTLENLGYYGVLRVLATARRSNPAWYA
jgi:hypothetical protein